jgi:isopenicillin-N N-acyltransferase-like protein
MAAAAHILVADKNSSIGFEFSSSTTARLRPDSKGRLMHSNHLLAEHPGVTDTVWLKNSPFRNERMAELSETLQNPTWDEVSRLFEDEKNAPAAICRARGRGDR